MTERRPDSFPYLRAARRRGISHAAALAYVQALDRDHHPSWDELDNISEADLEEVYRAWRTEMARQYPDVVVPKDASPLVASRIYADHRVCLDDMVDAAKKLRGRPGDRDVANEDRPEGAAAPPTARGTQQGT